jgi:hypothetical protein
LLLDEHYSKLIAEQLRNRGHDVVSATERSDLAGLKDRELFALMAAEHRAILTENWADFQREIRRAEDEGVTHYGVVLTSNRQMPRSKKTVGLYVRILDDFLRRRRTEDAILNSYRWLPE